MSASRARDSSPAERLEANPHLCTTCQRRPWEEVVFVEHDEAGKPTGPFVVLCHPCLLDEMR